MDTENKIRILLVEDNPDDCKWYQNCYSVIPGVELSVVNTMTEGVRAVRERRPDALILDHQLTEGKSSIDLLEEIRTFVNLDEIPSVTLMRTGSGPVEDIYTMDYGTAYVWHKDDTGYAQTGPYEVLSLLRRCVPKARRRRRMREQGIAVPRQVGWAFDDDETQLCLISEYLAKYVSWEQGDMQHVYVAKGIQHQIHIGGILVELENKILPLLEQEFKGATRGTIRKGMQRFVEAATSEEERRTMMADYSEGERRALRVPGEKPERIRSGRTIRPFICHCACELRIMYGWRAKGTGEEETK
ncbi:response regulator [Lawsonibacter faecis]|uniref:Stage 0 sporulation protein A homolog n=1 Tax=Lawsonibacter faecis TaxID=2763052 RepID=A0A8J6JKU1_9FIRM|nr:hypothetical protein [Lawsonibacter faecis]MBC5736035.1 hypothetical protein [Lawsonibacter faecis]